MKYYGQLNSHRLTFGYRRETHSFRNDGKRLEQVSHLNVEVHHFAVILLV